LPSPSCTPWLPRPKDASSKPSEHTGTTADAGRTSRSLRRPGLAPDVGLTEGATV
jgi:hypothetical protein